LDVGWGEFDVELRKGAVATITQEGVEGLLDS